MGFYKKIILTNPRLQKYKKKKKKDFAIFDSESLFVVVQSERWLYYYQINAQQLHNALTLGFFTNLFPCAFGGL